MQRNWKKLWPAAATSLVAFTSFVNAQNAQTNDAQVRNLENRVSALEQRKGASGMINPPGRPQVRNGCDLFVYGDLIYWNAHESGLAYAVVNEGSDTTLADAQVKNLHGKWNWGFRVGVGYNMPHDGWDVNFTWLRFTDTSHKRVHAGTDDFIFPTMTAASDPLAEGFACNKAHGYWGLRLDQLDLDMGREFFVSKWLTLRPHFGVRSDWVKQKLDVDYDNFDLATNVVDVKSKDKWWGLGLEGGLDTQWGLGSGWSLFGDLTGAIIYGFHKTRFNDTDSPGSTHDNVSNTYRISHPILDLQMGLRWDNMFGDDSYHLGVQVAWEHHVYFSQNQLPNFGDPSNMGRFYTSQGDLTLQGWTFAARFDF